MGKKVPRNALCPCGSGKKYKHCCIGKEFDWVETDDGNVARSLPISEEVMGIVRGLRNAYVAQHGREPTHIFEGAPHSEVIEHWTVEAMKKAGIDPALMYAYEKTGLLLNAKNESKVPDSDIAEWEAAIDEYELKTRSKAAQKRLSDEDFARMMQHGPQERRQAQTVERLPFPPPFTPEEWGTKHLRDIIDDPKCFDYLKRCLKEVNRSGRSSTYLDMFLVMTHCNGLPTQDASYPELIREARKRQFTADELEQALEVVAATCGPKQALPNAVSAFEFLGFIGDFMNLYADKQGMQEQLGHSLEKINGMALFAFGAAVNAELGVQEDIWKP